MCLACCPKVIETKKTLAVEFLFPIHLQVNDIEKIINLLMHKVPKGQTHFKNLAANAARFLKCVWPFWDLMY